MYLQGERWRERGGVGVGLVVVGAGGGGGSSGGRQSFRGVPEEAAPLDRWGVWTGGEVGGGVGGGGGGGQSQR